MKKVLSGVACAAVIGWVGIAMADTITFNFETSSSITGPVSGLQTYLVNTFGSSNIATNGIEWYSNSTLFDHSDVLYVIASNGSGTIDFDTLSAGASNYKINSLQFEWGVYEATDGRDFGLDVYDDATNAWRNNVFEINGVNYDTGLSGLLTFNSSWQVTAIRFHDSGYHDVAMDNLIINDNRTSAAPVPEPTTMLLFGTGLAGLAAVGRRRKA